MIRYIAFLRGINVSGQKIIKMEALREVLVAAEFADVKTYIQSGNILFNAKNQSLDKLILTIEKLIEKSFGFRTDVILRKVSDIDSLVKSPLFIKLKSDEVKFYITFLKTRFSEQLSIPQFSKNKDVEIIYHNSFDLISISTLYKGTFGFPNNFIEKQTGIAATTRNPNTLEKILKL